MTCKCFTCTHKDPRLKKAYCIGYMEACEWFLNWAKEQGIKMGSISDNDLGGVYAQINCNYQETGCYARELPDIDEVPRKTDEYEQNLEKLRPADSDLVYRVKLPRKTTGKIEKIETNADYMQLSSSSMNKNQDVADMIMEKINELVDAVNELKGAKNE